MAQKRDEPIAASKDTQASVSLIGAPELLRGVYSNVVVIHHTAEEIVLDFLFSAGGQAHLVSRVVLGPDHASRLVKALTDHLRKFARNAKKTRKVGKAASNKPMQRPAPRRGR